MQRHLLDGLQQEIEEVARRKIRAHERRATNLRDENARRQRRSLGAVDIVASKRPDLWQHAGHDPYRVLRNARVISYSIVKAVKAGEYAPLPPRGFTVKKADGSPRRVGVFALADEVVSRRVYTALMSKNLPRLSARSYAYRKDRGVHDALTYIDSEWRSANRLFVAEYDFAQYFDEISHEHIEATISSLRLSVTPTERRIYESILRAPLPLLRDGDRTLARTKGVPLGTSVSLFLANVAATPLDRNLERRGVNFARFADDVLIWSQDYSSMCAASEIMYEFARASGTRINALKSEGIRLLIGPGDKGEMRHTRSVTYLSHKLALDGMGMKDETVSKLLSQVDRLIYDNLLREPLRGKQSLGRLTENDRDYVTLVWQLRRLLYGNLSEEQVRRLAAGQAYSGVMFSGALAHFALVDDWKALGRLDGEILSRVWLALRQREGILSASYPMQQKVVPWGAPMKDLKTLRSSSTRNGSELDLRFPSVVRFMRAAQSSLQIHGTEVFGRSSAFYEG